MYQIINDIEFTIAADFFKIVFNLPQYLLKVDAL